ncbi:MAG: DUF1294 domain-containing protein [Opitutales bacterium]
MSAPFLLGWVLVTSLWTFGMFGYDKWRAAHAGGRRVAESTLLLSSLLGGWPGGLLGMLVFRHKSAKPAFLLPFAVTVLVWLALGAVVLRRLGKI